MPPPERQFDLVSRTGLSHFPKIESSAHVQKRFAIFVLADVQIAG